MAGEQELRAIDVRIAREVMGWTVALDERDGEWLRSDKPCDVLQMMYGVPHYTRSDADALAALDKVLEEESRRLGSYGVHSIVTGWRNSCNEARYTCNLYVSDVERWEFISESRPLAICRAILEYLDHKKEHPHGR